jgi:hypothetical protein
MFRFLKPKLNIEAFGRLILQYAYEHIVTFDDPAGELDTESVLTDHERSRVNDSFRQFKFVCAYVFLFMKIARGELAVPIDRFNYYIGLALFVVFKDDLGLPEEDARGEAQRYLEVFEQRYMDLLEQHSIEDDPRRSLDFLACQRFAESTLDGLDLTKEIDREKRGVLFSMSKNLLKISLELFEKQYQRFNLQVK